MKEPRWLPLACVQQIHQAQRAQWGRFTAIEETSFTIIEAIAKKAWSNSTDVDIFDLAAIYGVKIIREGLFLDESPALALLSMSIFLYLNGYLLDAPQHIAFLTISAIRSESVGEKEIAAWLRLYCRERT